MIRIKQNKDKSIHGTYRSPEVTLKLLLENKPALASSLKHKIETFMEGDEGILLFSFDHRKPGAMLKLEREKDSYQVSLTQKMEINKEHMDGIVTMLTDMSLACDRVAEEDPVLGSSTNLLVPKTESTS